MTRETTLIKFLSASPYSASVDIKKLKFIFSAIEEHASQRGKDLHILRILEVACGRGGITLPLTTLGCQVTAFDIDQDEVSHLRSQINQKEDHHLTLTVDNAYTFDDENTYDIIIASEVFEHVLEPIKLAENIVRRMTEGAYLIVTTPNGYGPWEIKNRLDPHTYLNRWNLLRRLKGKPPYVRGSGACHCQFYTRTRLIGMFSSLSFKLVHFGKSDSFLSIFRSLRNNRFLADIDVRIADNFPYWFASGWYFVFEFQGANSTQTS